MTRSFEVTLGYRLTIALALGVLLASVAAAAPADTVWWRGYTGYAWWGEQPRQTMQRLVFAKSFEVAAVPTPLALALAREASDFDHDRVGSTGAIGVMQLLPATAAREFGVSAAELLDPITNVRLGLHYLARLHWRYDGNWEMALSHYRGGPLPWRAGRYRPHAHTRVFVDRVMGWWWRYERDPLVRDWTPRPQWVPRFRERFGGPEQPGFTYEPPTRYRWPAPWIAITGDRFR